MDKKGMEIAISTVVTLILGALMLFAGIALFSKFMVDADDISAQVDSGMEEQILKAFDNNDPIFVYRTEMSPATRENVVVFWAGIHNIHTTQRKFNVTLKWTDVNNKDNSIQYISEYEIPAKGKKVFPMIVSVDNLVKGQHSILLNVSINNTAGFVQYDRPKMLYVKI